MAIRKVTQHYQETSGKWVVRLSCGHVMFTSRDDHSRKVKGRFCPSCPGANRALMADLHNEVEHKMKRVVEASKPLADYLTNFGKKDPA